MKKLSFLIGRSSRYFILQIIFPILLIINYGSLFLSSIIYPNTFSILTHTITDLGNPILNPLGWPLFSFAFYTFSLLLIPIAIYLHKNLVKFYRIPTYFGTGFNILSIIIIFLLPMTPNFGKFIPMHYIIGFFSFFLLAFSITSYWIALVKYERVTIKKSALMISLLIIFGSMIGISQTIIPLLYNIALFPLFEWFFFIILGYELVSISIITPEFHLKFLKNNTSIISDNSINPKS